MRTDLQLDESTNDLAIANGDFVAGLSAQQEVQTLVEAQPGECREFPLSYFGISRYLNKQAGGATINHLARFRRDLTVALEGAGHLNPSITVTENLSIFTIEVEP